jgi:hypothetical protein
LENRVNLPLGFKAGPFPSAHGYLQRHKEDSHAQYCTMQSRDAFLGLIVLCTFTISTTKPVLHHNPQLWVSILQYEDASIQASWIEDLARSAATDFSKSIGQVSIIVHVSDTEQTEFIECMILTNVPIWLYWGSKDNLPIKHHARLCKYLPHTSQLSTPQRPLAPTEAISMNIKLPAGLRQRQNEDWKAYFIQRTSQQAKYIECKSNDQHSRHESCEEKNATFLTPKRKGAHVFH